MPWFERPSAIKASTSLAGGELVERVVATAPEQAGDDLGVERRAALGYPSHGVDEVLDVADAVLEEVAHPLRALGDEIERGALRDVLGEHDHGDVGKARANLKCGPQAVVGVGRGHAHVGDDDVGAMTLDLPQKLIGVGGLGHHLEALV